MTNSIFDLASLTKVVVTTTISMILYDRDQLKLDWKVQDIIPDFKGKDKEQITIRHLLTHTAGLPGWIPFFQTIKGKGLILNAIYDTPLEYQPGTQSMYSDLGMILMQKVLETLTQKPLDLLVTENITSPLGMERTLYNPDRSLLNEIVPTEISEWHKGLVRGFVHDENSFAMGGVSGHAGLFSTVEDLSAFCQMYLNGGIYAHMRLLDMNTITLFTQRVNLVPGSTRAIGWDTRSEENSMSGDLMSLQAFGHSGFTGTTIWIDPVNDLFVVFLTNRVHPTRQNNKIRQVRPRVHDYIMRSVLN
jgi:CubicO group peptidase (beta-lactamase class C family)